MLRAAWLVALKDLRLMLQAGQGLAQALLLGLLLVFVFSLSRPPGEIFPAQSAAAIFWLASAFAVVLVYNALFSLEEQAGARVGLLLSPAPVQAVWLGKASAGFLLVLACQAILGPAAVVFLGQDVSGGFLSLALVVLGVDWGLAVLGALLGAMSQGQAARESLMSVVLFPLLAPLLLAGVKLLTGWCGGAALDGSWLGIVGAFDAIFTAAALALFPFAYSGEE
ncbi:MAG: heme exporter protein [Desulfovibrionales bacterium]|jgi:heme exporter protein B|nr:heme exporter protein [Desulfovibrionales bacterium]